MNYSNIRKQLGIDNVKQFDETMAYVTHYLQNLGYDAVNNYEELAINHVTGIDLNNIVYDIPFSSPANPSFTFIDLFAGIGGMRLAFQNLGGKCIFSSEWDSYAQKHMN